VIASVPKLITRICWLILCASALAFGLIASGGAYKMTPPFIDSGAVMTWTNQLLALATVVMGLVIAGLLIVHGFLAPGDAHVLVGEPRRAIKFAGRLAFGWAILYFLSAITTLGAVLGTNLPQTLAPGVIQTYILDLAPSKSLLISGLLALIAGFGSLLARSLNTVAAITAIAVGAIVYPLLNSHSAALGDHSLAITASVLHGVSMSLWVGSLIAIYPFIKARNSRVTKRYSLLATTCVVVLVISGVISAAVRMQSPADLLNSGYGFLVAIKIALFGVIGFCALRARSTLAEAGRATIFVVWEITTMALAVGVGVALHFTPPTRIGVAGKSAAEDILGFNFPPAPSSANYIFGWYPDWLILIIALTAAALYLVGTIRLKRADIAWPPLRTVSFFTGISVLIWVTCSGLSKYAMLIFSAHMIQHMVLAMIAPIFLVLGAPITLALRALPAANEPDHRNARSWIIALLHSQYSRVVTAPLFVLFIFTISLYGIYFTSAFSTLMSSHVGHIAMELHFLITGLLFTFVVIGVDPAPRRLPYWSRLLLVLVALSLHAFFALAIMQSSSPIGDTWYAQVKPPWVTNSLDVTYTAGGIAWAIGELPTFVLLIVVAVQWSRDDSRKAAQQDRAADRDNDLELKEYNERLNRLNSGPE